MKSEKTFESDGREYLVILSFGDWTDKFKIVAYDRLLEHRQGGSGKWREIDVSAPSTTHLQERASLRLGKLLQVIKPEWIEELKKDLLQQISNATIRA